VELGLIEGFYARRELKSQKFLEDEIVVVAAPSHPLAKKNRRLSLADLAAAPWVLREPGSTIKGLVETGVGLGFLSRLALRHEVETAALVELPVEGLEIRRALQILRFLKWRRTIQVRDFSTTRGAAVSDRFPLIWDFATRYRAKAKSQI